MRLFPILLSCLMLVACGKTGALFLPEEAADAQAPSTAQPDAQSQDREAGSDAKAD